MPKGDYKNLDITKEQFLELLEEKNGNLYATYTTLGLPYNRFARWREEDKDFDAAIEKIKNKTKQWVESKLFAFIEGSIGDPQTQARMTQFYLKCQGGYTEKKEVTLNSTNTVDINTALDEIKKDLEND